MHAIAEIGTNVPAFLGKLWKMVEDPVTSDLITWNSNGTSFVIKDEIRFARELLPMYYKHNNMASFIRQLNMYGFHKIVSPDAGSMKMEFADEIKFTHQYFLRGHPYLLENIKRKIGVSKGIPSQMGEKAPQVINKVLTDVRQLKGRQENMDSRLTAMKLENDSLWRELSTLRQKHIKQQQIVNKLIQFLVTIVQQNHTNFTVKRKFPRMLQHHISTKHEDDVKDHVENTDNNPSNSPMGPIIHELDTENAEALLETVVEEAGTEIQEDVSEYFLNESSEDNEDAVVDVDSPHLVFNISDTNPETIIGMPEDTLFVNVEKKNQRTDYADNTSRKSVFVGNKVKKQPESFRPKYLKMITRKPKRAVANQQKVQQRLVAQKTKKQLEKNLRQQIEINQQQIEINEQQIKRNEEQQLQRNEEQELQKRQHQQLKKKLQQHKNQQQLQKSQLQQLQRNQRPAQKAQQQQGLLSQSLQEQPEQQPTSEPVITIPFDSGTSGGILAEESGGGVESLYLDSGTENLILPVVTLVAPTEGLSPSQDMIMVHDPVMTPQGEQVATPIITPLETSPNSNSEMQVACVEEPQVTSPSLVTRYSCPSKNTGPLRIEMDDHLETMQSDLDNLRELLRSEGISLDANTLLGYFNDDPLSYNISDPVGGGDLDRTKESEGNELMTYSPSLFDLTDLMGNEWSLPTSPNEQVTADDSFAEVHTPQFMPNSPSFPTAAKMRKK